MFRRPFRRAMRPAMRPDVPPLLRRAHELMAAGNYVAAAQAFENLAHDLPRQATLVGRVSESGEHRVDDGRKRNRPEAKRRGRLRAQKLSWRENDPQWPETSLIDRMRWQGEGFKRHARRGNGEGIAQRRLRTHHQSRRADPRRQRLHRGVGERAPRTRRLPGRDLGGRDQRRRARRPARLYPRRAKRMAWERSATCSLEKILEMWLRTVLPLMVSRAAISALL